jgi:hypothetical protein
MELCKSPPQSLIFHSTSCSVHQLKFPSRLIHIGRPLCRTVNLLRANFFMLKSEPDTLSMNRERYDIENDNISTAYH